MPHSFEKQLERGGLGGGRLFLYTIMWCSPTTCSMSTIWKSWHCPLFDPLRLFASPCPSLHLCNKYFIEGLSCAKHCITTAEMWFWSSWNLQSFGGHRYESKNDTSVNTRYAECLKEKIKVMICTSLKTEGAESPFMCLLAICFMVFGEMSLWILSVF